MLAGRGRWSRVAGIVGILIVAVPVAQRLRIELTRFSNSSYFMDTANRELLARLPTSTGADPGGGLRRQRRRSGRAAARLRPDQ